MNKLTPAQKINNLILILEAKQHLQYEDLKATIDKAVDQMQPSNFITNIAKSILFTEQLQAPLAASVVNLIRHWITRKQHTESSKSIFQKLADYSIQYISKHLFSTNKL